MSFSRLTQFYLKLACLMGLALYSDPQASATVLTAVRPVLMQVVTVNWLLEPVGGLIYMNKGVNPTVPMGTPSLYVNEEAMQGVGIGARAEVPFWRGLEADIGYQFAALSGRNAPNLHHHLYGAIGYRIDSLRFFSPRIEGGGGVTLLQLRQGGPKLQATGVLHVEVSLDFIIKKIIIGAYARYLIFPSRAMSDPGALSLGLRLGLRTWE